MQWREDGNLEAIRLDEKVEFDSDKVLRFVVFRGETIYSLEIDDRRFQWGAPKIRGDVIKKLANVNPIEYGVWQQKSKGDDIRIGNDEFAELQEQVVEVFYTAKMESTEGNVEVRSLPRRCRRYLLNKAISFREDIENGIATVTLHDFALPKSKFDADSVSLLLVLPDGYPDASPGHVLPSPLDKKTRKCQLSVGRRCRMEISRNQLAAMVATLE